MKKREPTRIGIESHHCRAILVSRCSTQSARPQPKSSENFSNEHRLSDAHAWSPSKDLAQHTQAPHMSVTLNQQAMEHAMASRPAITDPVAPGEIVTPFNLRLSRSSLEVGRRTRGRPGHCAASPGCVVRANASRVASNVLQRQTGLLEFSSNQPTARVVS